ncbi:hypothetical protein ACFL1Z_03650, partial [Thermodesulfobacteriota bacterium]
MLNISEKYPIWFKWRWQVDVPTDSRKGIPRRGPVPIGGKKYKVAMTMILHPRGQTLKEIADVCGSTPGLVGK